MNNINERIRLLAEQAGAVLLANPENPNSDLRILLSSNFEKFAELIVWECALVANQHNEEVEGVHLGVGRAIKQNFGVE